MSVPVLNLDTNVLFPFKAACIWSLADVAFELAVKVPDTLISPSLLVIEYCAGVCEILPASVHASLVLFAVINPVDAPAVKLPVVKLPPAVRPPLDILNVLVLPFTTLARLPVKVTPLR